MYIYLVEAWPDHDYIGMPPNFTPEAYAKESSAADRVREIEHENGQWGGMCYGMQRIKIITD